MSGAASEPGLSFPASRETVSPFTINNVSVCLKKIAGYSPAVSLLIIFFAGRVLHL